MDAIYTPENTTPAYQLNWSVSLFAKVDLPPASGWLEQLKIATESDGVRILEFHATLPNLGQFLVSTLPEVSPSDTVRSLKGRWQYLLRSQHPSAFRRNYHIVSIGEVNCQVLDQYIARQTSKHRMADPHVQQRLQALQFHDPAIDLGEVITGNYGQFIYGLQVVMENTGGWNEIRQEMLEDSRDMLVRAAAKNQWRLSRIGILSNHIHVMLGATMTWAPATVALSLMNNLAYVQA